MDGAFGGSKGENGDVVKSWRNREKSAVTVRKSGKNGDIDARMGKRKTVIGRSSHTAGKA
jgi:hypothetical protein